MTRLHVRTRAHTHTHSRSHSQSILRTRIRRTPQSAIIPRKVESDQHDQITEDQDATLKVVALSFAVHVREQDDTENDGDHVPLWEDEGEGVAGDFFSAATNNTGVTSTNPTNKGITRVQSREGNEGGYLEKTDLQGIGGSDFHGQGNVAVHGERDGVLIVKAC